MNDVWDSGFWSLLNESGRSKILMWLQVGVKDRDTFKDSGMEEEPEQGIRTEACSSLGELGRRRKQLPERTQTALTLAFSPAET